MTPDKLPDLLPRMSAAEIEAHRALAELARKWCLRSHTTAAFCVYAAADRNRGPG